MGDGYYGNRNHRIKQNVVCVRAYDRTCVCVHTSRCICYMCIIMFKRLCLFLSNALFKSMTLV